MAGRITLLSVGIAVLTALLAAALAIGLTRSTAEQAGQRTLARVADAAAERVDAGTPARAIRVLGVLGVHWASVSRGGEVTSTNALARSALTPGRQAALLAGTSISAREDLGGTVVLIEGRPTQSGGVLVVQRRSDAVAASDQLIRRVLVALLLAAIVAVGVSAAMARRLGRPLRSTADAAHALASGEREVTVPVEGPTEVAEVASALNALSTSLTRSERRQRDFLLSISHDLRTPLTGIVGYAESLAGGLVPPEETARVGAVVLGEAQRLQRFVADLLDLARLGAEQPQISLQPTDLVEVGRIIETIWSKRCAAFDVPFSFVAAVPQAWTLTDPARIRELVDGLLENALRVTPTGAPIVVEVRSAEGGPPEVNGGDANPVTVFSGGSWVIEVRDGGPGLTDEDLPVAFEPSVLYERYRGVRPVGTGLGLAIVGRLAQLLDGSIEAGHASEGGARFTVRLPLSPVGPSEQARPAH